MKYCPYCKVQIEGEHCRCPLCHNQVNDSPGRTYEAFPELDNVVPHKGFLYRLLQFLSIATAVISLAINYAMPGERVWWSFFVLAGIGCGWLCLLVFIRKRHNPMKALVWQVVLGMVLSVAWDFGTGWRGWSVDFVIPALLMCAMGTTLVLIFALKVPMEESVGPLCVLILLGLVPVVFILTDVGHFLYFSLGSVVASILYLAALCTLQTSSFLAQLRRRFHL